MKKIYIDVRGFSEDKRKKVQDAFFKLGYAWGSCGQMHKYTKSFEAEVYGATESGTIFRDCRVSSADQDEADITTYEQLMELAGMSEFTKDDLKDGMRVELGDGTVCYKIKDSLVLDHMESVTTIQSWGCDLTYTHHKDCRLDIVKVTDRDGTVLFEREPKRKVTLELTDEQIESLKEQGVIDEV